MEEYIEGWKGIEEDGAWGRNKVYWSTIKGNRRKKRYVL